MKRKIAIFSASLALLFVLSACGTSVANTKNNAQPGQQDSQGNPSGRGRNTPDYGQPKRTADVRGVVKSIIGNEATVLKMDIPSGERNASSTPSGTSSSTRPAISLTGTGNVPSGGTRGGGNFRGPGGAGEGGTTDRAAMLAELKKMSTGEEKVIIPVCIQMLKSSVDTTTKKRSMIEATLEDITADKMITIWLNASVTDKKVAEFILIN